MSMKRKLNTDGIALSKQLNPCGLCIRTIRLQMPALAAELLTN